MKPFVAAIVLSCACALAHAHSSSDAFLTLTVDGASIEGRWDIALRDLHFVLGLDDDGDGAITWAEMKRHRADIESYAYRNLQASAEGRGCAVERGTHLVVNRADGAYASLAFRIACRSDARKVTLDYRLLFDVDPTHRGIVVVRKGGATSTSLVSPANPRIDLTRF